MQIYILVIARLLVCLAAIIISAIIMFRSERKIIRCISMILAILACCLSEQLSTLVLMIFAMIIMLAFVVLIMGFILLLFGSAIFSLILSPIATFFRKIFH